MPNYKIQIDNLGKKYAVHNRNGANRDRRFSEVISEAFTKPFRAAKNRKNQIDGQSDFWALRNVSLDIAQGEVIGIVGRNGAGKSTLLKILSRITEPTEGRVRLKGRIASLLEVGTGFHPELTGRENILLNGAILGMKTSEIRKQFDEIVAFAEVERFLDTPVKRYSSGMYVRLAFAVAAHLDPEILVIDEVLAVGDSAFQKKCLGRMKDVAEGQGRTVLFVSHNMPTVLGICQKTMWLHHGKAMAYGPTVTVVDEYIASFDRQDWEQRELQSDAGDFEVVQTLIGNIEGETCNTFRPGDGLTLNVHYRARQPIVRPHFWFRFFGKDGPVFDASSLVDGYVPDCLEGEGQFQVAFPSLPLSPDQVYTVRMGARRGDANQSFLLPTSEFGNFRVKASPADFGFTGDDVCNGMGNVASLLVPYTWKFAGADPVEVDPIGHIRNPIVPSIARNSRQCA